MRDTACVIRRTLLALAAVLAFAPASTAMAAANGLVLSSYRGQVWATGAHHATRLTHDSVNDGAAVVSPNGKLIAFARGTALGDIWIMNANGSSRRLLTPHHFAFAPGFSADGQLVGWHDESRAYGWNGVFVASLDGSGIRRADAGQGHAGERESLGPPRFRPGGGSFLSYAWDIIADPNVDPLNPAIDLVDLTTGQHQKLVRGDFDTPDWSPDGQRFVASHLPPYLPVPPDVAPGGTLTVFAADGHVQRVIAHDAQNGIWSPDGRWILYQYSWCDPSEGDVLCTLAVHPNGRGTHGVAVRGIVSDWEPCFAHCRTPGRVPVLRLSMRMHGNNPTFRATAGGRPVGGVRITVDNPNTAQGFAWVTTRSDGRATYFLPKLRGRWSAIARRRGYIPARVFFVQ